MVYYADERCKVKHGDVALLQGTSVIRDCDGHQLRFEILVAAQEDAGIGRHFVFQAQTADDLRCWLDALKCALGPHDRFHLYLG